MQAPEAGTRERWAWDYIHATSLAGKLAPDPPPESWEHDAPVRRIEIPGRPPDFV